MKFSLFLIAQLAFTKKCDRKTDPAPVVNYSAQQPAAEDAPQKPPPDVTPKLSNEVAVNNQTSAAGSNSAYPAGIPDNLIFKNVDSKKVATLNKKDPKAKARADNAWMAQCKQGYAFCCWSQTNNQNVKQVCDKGLQKESGKMHCHGTVIYGQPGSKEFFYSQLALNYVQIHDHLQNRGTLQPFLDLMLVVVVKICQK